MQGLIHGMDYSFCLSTLYYGIANLFYIIWLKAMFLHLISLILVSLDFLLFYKHARIETEDSK